MLAKLTEIERSIGVVDVLSLRKMILEAQDYILQCQKESIEQLRQKRRAPPPPTEIESLAD